MDAAISLHHHHGELAALPPAAHHHRALSLQPRRASISSAASSKAPAARLALAARSGPAVPAAARSSRAATGYAAALADKCARAGTLRRASRHARALLLFRHQPSSEETTGHLDARVAALVSMLVGKGKAWMVAEVMAEFAAICDKLLPLPARAHAY